MTAVKKRRFFYGWVIVFASLSVMTVTVGLHQSFGVFFKPLLLEFGWTRAQAAGAFSVGNVIQGAAGVAVGLLANRYGPRPFIVLSGVLLGLSYVLVAQVAALWQLYIFYSLLQGLGRGAHFNPMIASVARWFTERRGLALGLVLSGGGIGTVLFPVLADSLIRNFNWRVSFMVFGAISAAVLIAAALVMRSSPKDMGLQPYGEKPPDAPEGKAQAAAIASANSPSAEQGATIRQAMRSRSFWFLMLTGGAGSFAVNLVFVHLVAYATDMGVAAAVAAGLISVTGVSNIAGKLVMGVFSDHYGLKLAMIVCFGLAAATMLWASQASSAWMFFAFAVFFGFAYAGWIPLFPGMAAHLFGLRSMSAVVGFQTLGNNLGGAAGAFFAGYIFDVTHSYSLAFVLAASLLAMSIVLHLMTRPPEKRPYTVLRKAP